MAHLEAPVVIVVDFDVVVVFAVIVFAVVNIIVCNLFVVTDHIIFSC